MAIRQRHGDALRAIHDVAVRQDIAVGGEDDPRACALGDAWHDAVHRLPHHRLLDADLHHRWAGAIHDGDHRAGVGVESFGVGGGWPAGRAFILL